MLALKDAAQVNGMYMGAEKGDYSFRNYGEYLLLVMLHRIVKKNDVNKDKWIGIGGKFEPGESPEDCVLDRKSTRLNSSHITRSRMPSSA